MNFPLYLGFLRKPLGDGGSRIGTVGLRLVRQDRQVGDARVVSSFQGACVG